MQIDKRGRQFNRIKHEDKVLCYRYFNGEGLVELDKPLELIVVDISVGGVGLKSKQTFNNGSVLIFDLDFGLSKYKVQAKVLWSIQQDDYSRIGLKFVSMPNTLKKELNDLKSLTEAL